MKLLMIIAGDEYADEITSILVENNYRATNIGSSGDFLQYGYTVLMVGVLDNDVQNLINLLNGETQDKKLNFHNEVMIHVIDIDDHVKMHNIGKQIKSA